MTEDTHYVYLGLGPLRRANLVREPHQNRFDQASLSLEGRGTWGRLDAALSLIEHGFKSRYDASSALRRFGSSARVGALDEDKDIHLAVGEMVLASPGHRALALAGRCPGLHQHDPHRPCVVDPARRTPDTLRGNPPRHSARVGHLRRNRLGPDPDTDPDRRGPLLHTGLRHHLQGASADADAELRRQGFVVRLDAQDRPGLASQRPAEPVGPTQPRPTRGRLQYCGRHWPGLQRPGGFTCATISPGLAVEPGVQRQGPLRRRPRPTARRRLRRALARRAERSVPAQRPCLCGQCRRRRRRRFRGRGELAADRRAGGLRQRSDRRSPHHRSRQPVRNPERRGPAWRAQDLGQHRPSPIAARWVSCD